MGHMTGFSFKEGVQGRDQRGGDMRGKSRRREESSTGIVGKSNPGREQPVRKPSDSSWHVRENAQRPV